MMIVSFEFLVAEPIDNVITNLNFKIDKTVYFGYAENIRRYGTVLEDFLKKYCGNTEVSFIQVPKGRLKDTLGIMRSAVQDEKDRGSKVFFDVTGGDPLPLVAIGILSTETDTPMHIFNIDKENFRELEEGADYEISREVPRRKVPFTIDMLIELRGGAVKSSTRKKNKVLDNETNIATAEKVAALFEKHTGEWGRLVKGLNSCMAEDGEGIYHIDYNKVADYFYPAFTGTMRNFVGEIRKQGLIKMFSNEEDEKRFRFISDFAHDNLTEEGAALELRTCLELRKKYGQAQAGVQVDWNGITDEIHDVENEIDVIALDGYIPVIVSCKCGNQANKDAIYELETVAERFGGKYARKVLVSAKNMSPVDLNRAREMGIEVQVINKNIKVKNYNKR